MNTTATNEKKRRAHQACDSCKHKKVKCDGEKVRPCTQCKKREIPCQWTTPSFKRGRKPIDTKEKQDEEKWKKKFVTLIPLGSSEDSGSSQESDSPASAQPPTIQNNIHIYHLCSHQPATTQITTGPSRHGQDQDQEDPKAKGTLNPNSISNIRYLPYDKPENVWLPIACAKAFQFVIQPQHRYFTYPFNDYDIRETWHHLSLNANTAIISWSAFSKYFSSSLVLYIGLKELGGPAYLFYSFMNGVCNKLLPEVVDKIPPAQVPQITETLLLKAFTDFTTNEFTNAISALQLVYQFYDKYASILPAALIHRILAASTLNPDVLYGDVIRETMKLGETDIANDVMLLTLLFARLYTYTPPYHFAGIHQRVDSDDLRTIWDSIEKIENYFSECPPSSDWDFKLLFLTTSIKAATYSFTKEHALEWVRKSLLIANRIEVNSSCVDLHLHLLIQICKKFNETKFLPAIQAILQRLEESVSCVRYYTQIEMYDYKSQQNNPRVIVNTQKDQKDHLKSFPNCTLSSLLEFDPQQPKNVDYGELCASLFSENVPRQSTLEIHIPQVQALSVYNYI